MDPVQSDGRRLARQLESNLAADMVSAARPPRRQGMFDGGAGAGAFDSFMDHALGDALAARGTLGLAPAIERVITGRPGLQGAPR